MFSAYTGGVSVPVQKKEVALVPCHELLVDDLGWGLGTILRSYVTAATAAMEELPGGPRGYQILTAAAHGDVASQLALAQRLGVDRTVMTYLLDDLESAKLIERCPDPTDRRARRIVATRTGQDMLVAFSEKLAKIETRLLAPLDPSDRVSFRSMIQTVATKIDEVMPSIDPCGEAVEGCETMTERPSA